MDTVFPQRLFFVVMGRPKGRKDLDPHTMAVGCERVRGGESCRAVAKSLGIGKSSLAKAVAQGGYRCGGHVYATTGGVPTQINPTPARCER